MKDSAINTLQSARLFINPAAGRWSGKKLAPKIRNYLHQRGLVSKATFTRSPGDLIELSKQACLDGCETIIVAGGDGTIYEAVNGIMQAKELMSAERWSQLNPKLGIIPIGTGNDFIKSARIPKDTERACDHLLNANPTLVDVGKINTENHHSFFINNIGAGFDGMIGLTGSKIPIIKGPLVYVLALVWHLIKGIPRPNLDIRTDTFKLNKEMTLVAITNGTTYGGAFKISPNAKLNDGKLDCVVAPATNRISVLPLLFQLIRGKHLQNPSVTYNLCENISIQTDKPIVVVADGELINEACTNFEVSVLKKELTILC